MKFILFMFLISSMSSFAAVTSGANQGGSFFLVLDGDSQGLKSLSGGNVRAEVAESFLGNSILSKKNISRVVNDDFSFSLVAPFSKKITDAISSMLNGNPLRVSGSVVTTDFNLKPMSERQFSDALISEISFPTLDASSKSSLTVDFKLAAEKIAYLSTPNSNTTLNRTPGRNVGLSTANFRMEIDGVKKLNVSKIDPIVLTQKLQAAVVGGSRQARLDPAKLVASNFTVYMAESQAKEIFAWYEDFILNGNNQDNDERTGRIVFMDPSLTNDLMTLEFSHMGIVSYELMELQANSNELKKVKVVFYYEKVSLK